MTDLPGARPWVPCGRAGARQASTGVLQGGVGEGVCLASALTSLFSQPVLAKVLQLRGYCVGLASPTSSCCLVTRYLVHQEEGVLELHPSCVGHGGVSARSG